jgi:hypothetical protein
MPDIATAPSTAERHVRPPDQGFEFREDWADFSLDVLPRRRQLQDSIACPLSDSNTIFWVQVTYANVDDRSVAPNPESCSEFLLSAPTEVKQLGRSIPATTTVESSALRREESFPKPDLRASAEQWIAELRAWISTHAQLPHEADDSRESIYEGRGE